MATETVPAAHETPELPIAERQRDRHRVALQAVYEIDSLVNMLLREQAQGDDFDFLIRSSLRRISILNGVSMSVLGSDEGRTTEDMAEVVHA